MTCTKQPSIANIREFFHSVFQGKYDIGDAGMRYFTIGFVSTMQVYPGREGREGDARERGMWEREMRYKERGRGES